MNEIMTWFLMCLCSATHCLEKLKMLIRLIYLQCKFINFKIQT